MGVSALQHRVCIGLYNCTVQKHCRHPNYNKNLLIFILQNLFNLDSAISGTVFLYKFCILCYIILSACKIFDLKSTCTLKSQYINQSNYSSPDSSVYLAYYLSAISPGIMHFVTRIRSARISRISGRIKFCCLKSFSFVKSCLRLLVVYNIFVIFVFKLNFILVTISNPSLKNPGPINKNRHITVMYNNIQGFINPRDLSSKTPPLNMKKTYELQGYIFKERPDIVILNETWLKNNILDSEIFHKTYKIFRTDRTGKTHPWDPMHPKKFRKNGGGVLIAHRNDIDCESTEVGLIKVKAELLSINFKLPTGKRLCISTFYRVGTLSTENFELVEKYFKKLACRGKLDKHVLVGDFNLSEVSWPDATTNVQLQQKFLDLFLIDLGHSQLISEPTHKSGHTLDLLFTNISNLINNVTVLGPNEVCKSDHFGIKFDIKMDVKTKKTIKRKMYNYSKANWKDLNYDIKMVDWEMLIGSQDPHVSWPNFKLVLSKLCDKYIPKKSVKDQFLPPWYDSDCDKVLREKEKWRKKAGSENATEEDHQKFRKLRSDFKKIMDQKMRFTVEDESDSSLISKKFWKHVKSYSKSTRIPETVWYGDCFKKNPADQANMFNKFFFEQFSDESNYDIDIEMGNADKFQDLYFHELDVQILLKNINSGKAAGPDGIHGTILKNCAVSLAKPLTKLFNISFVTGCIPEEWKLASVVPIHKKDEKRCVENYRPISLTSLVMKVFERCIQKELLAACGQFLDPRQHGFINGKSCTTQMVPFIHNLALNLNNKEKTDIIYFDFAKAFDSVSHDIILYKLKHQYKVDGLMLRFIRSYLQGRKQQVVVGGVTSETLSVKSGVPQGSILGPLLFIIFINDMFECISEGTNITLYADDTKIWRVINFSEDHFILQDDINKLYDWSINNIIKFHPSKCKALSVTFERNILHNLPFTIFNYKLGSNYIDYVSSQIDLGITVTSKLLWTNHHDTLLAKATSKLGLLTRTCHFTLNLKQKRTFYLALIRSLFEHCSVIWRPISNNQIYKFEMIQKRAIKWISGRQFDHLSDKGLYEKEKEFDILPIRFKFLLNDLVLFYKIVNSLVPISLPSEICLVKPKNVRYTRSTQNIISFDDKSTYTCNTKPCISAYENCYFYRTMTVWNKLSYSIRQLPSLSEFKLKLTEFIWSVDHGWPG